MRFGMTRSTKKQLCGSSIGAKLLAALCRRRTLRAGSIHASTVGSFAGKRVCFGDNGPQSTLREKGLGGANREIRMTRDGAMMAIPTIVGTLPRLRTPGAKLDRLAQSRSR